MIRKNAYPFFCFFILALVMLNRFYGVRSSYAQQESVFDYSLVTTHINITHVMEHVSKLSNFSSRVTGYEGCDKAAEYIYNFFKAHGLNSFYHEYNVVVPIDYGANITIFDNDGHAVRTINAYTMWPNLVQTCSIPPEGLKGKLIYAGSGELSEFNNKTVDGAIVLLEYNSGYNWIEAANLGARAVIFGEPDETTRYQSEAKVIAHPLYFPRLYVNRSDWEYLYDAASRGYNVVLHSRMAYENKIARNVIGVVKGTQYPNDVIIVASHYDTWSPVPRLAPGEDEAISTGVLLELARFFSQNPPLRTIWFVAFSGHWQALAGAREFTEKYYFSSEQINGSRRIIMLINLDLSTDGNKLALLYAGHFYFYGGPTAFPRYARWVAPQLTSVYIPEIMKQLRMGEPEEYIVNNLIGTSEWDAGMPTTFFLDSEPISVAGGIGIGLRTAHSFRFHWGLPISNMKYINLENLKPQMLIASCIVYSFANERFLDINPEEIKPQRVIVRAYYGAGYDSLDIEVRQYNMSKAWYDPVPHALVRVVRLSNELNIFAQIYAFADDRGKAKVNGIACVAASGSSINTEIPSIAYQGYIVEGWVVNFTNGVVEYAPDSGPYSWGSVVAPDRHPMPVFPVVFKTVASVSLFGFVEPQTMSDLALLDVRWKTPRVSVRWAIVPLNFKTLSNFQFYGYKVYAPRGIVTLFLSEDTPFMIKMRAGTELGVVGVLINATIDNPEGTGYSVRRGQEVRLTFTHLRFAEDLYSLVKNRLSITQPFNIYSPIAELTFHNGEFHLNKAKLALKEKKYDVAFSEAIVAWNWLSQCYRETMRMIYDVESTSVFFFISLIPFALIFERLTMASTGLKRILTILCIFIFFSGVLYFMHPGLHIAIHIYVVILGFATVALAIPFLGVIVGECKSQMVELRRRAIGAHFSEVSRVSIITTSVLIGIQNLRKRKFRSALLILSVTLVTFSLIALTSAPIVAFLRPLTILEGRSSYEGILVKKGFSTPTDFMSRFFPELIREVYGSEIIVAPRAFYYPPILAGGVTRDEIRGPNGTTTFSAFIGLTPEEDKVTNIGKLLVAGRWFLPGERYVTILNDKFSKAIGANVGDYVEWAGIKLRVVGILDADRADKILDLDQRGITPNDYSMMRPLPESQESPKYVPLSWKGVFILPYNFLLDIGGYVSSLAIKTANPEEANNIGSELALQLCKGGFNIYIGTEEGVYVYRRGSFPIFIGWETLTVPIVLALLTILNIMIGSVNERIREIGILSVVGLSPRNISMIFLIESAIIGFVSSVIGYIMGIVGIKALYWMGFASVEKGFIPNYSSIFVFIAVGLAIIFTVSSTIYPAIMASRIVTPSITRKWKVSVKPIGDEWAIRLPFWATTQREAVGILAFVKEYVEAHGSERAGEFVSMGVSITCIKRETRTLVALEGMVQLPPFEAGIQQLFRLISIPEESGRFGFELYMQRVEGVRYAWLSAIYSFADEIRRQLLLWRSLKDQDKEWYMNQVNLNALK